MHNFIEHILNQGSEFWVHDIRTNDNFNYRVSESDGIYFVSVFGKEGETYYTGLIKRTGLSYVFIPKRGSTENRCVALLDLILFRLFNKRSIPEYIFLDY